MVRGSNQRWSLEATHGLSTQLGEAERTKASDKWDWVVNFSLDLHRMQPHATAFSGDPFSFALRTCPPHTHTPQGDTRHGQDHRQARRLRWAVDGKTHPQPDTPSTTQQPTQSPHHWPLTPPLHSILVGAQHAARFQPEHHPHRLGGHRHGRLPHVPSTHCLRPACFSARHCDVRHRFESGCFAPLSVHAFKVTLCTKSKLVLFLLFCFCNSCYSWSLCIQQLSPLLSERYRISPDSLFEWVILIFSNMIDHMYSMILPMSIIKKWSKWIIPVLYDPGNMST